METTLRLFCCINILVLVSIQGIRDKINNVSYCSIRLQSISYSILFPMKKNSRKYNHTHSLNWQILAYELCQYLNTLTLFTETLPANVAVKINRYFISTVVEWGSWIPSTSLSQTFCECSVLLLLFLVIIYRYDHVVCSPESKKHLEWNSLNEKEQRRIKLHCICI